MCLRDSPTSLCPFGPVGQYTLVKISSDSRRSPLRISPSTVSAAPLAYTSAVSKLLIPASSGAHALRGHVVFDLGAVGQPVAVGDGGDFQAGAAEVAEFHGSTVDDEPGQPSERLVDRMPAGAGGRFSVEVVSMPAAAAASAAC